MKMQTPDQKSIAEFILGNLPLHKQFALSTIDKAGKPWTVCLNLSFDDEINIIWKSRSDTEHSQHLIARPDVSICVFSEQEGAGDFGFYAKALAHEVTNPEELARCLEVRYQRKGKPIPALSDFSGASPDRIYIAHISEAWVNDDSHVKTSIDLKTLRSLSNLRPRAYRAGALIIRDKKLLLVTSGIQNIYWSPGGRLEKEETSEECILRELQEELGIIPKKVAFAFSCLGRHTEAPTAESRFDYFVVEYPEGAFDPQDDEIEAMEWFSRDQLLASDAPLSEGIQATIVPWLIEKNLI